MIVLDKLNNKLKERCSSVRCGQGVKFGPSTDLSKSMNCMEKWFDLLSITIFSS